MLVCHCVALLLSSRKAVTELRNKCLLDCMLAARNFTSGCGRRQTRRSMLFPYEPGFFRSKIKSWSMQSTVTLRL
ncbi:hypothetical protein BDQ17DRAFT_1361677 [Cyathus striatus]|nr:hypothetical protein BDQ17DRAFT_1361677 [Cyathus striatus]